MMMVPHEWWMMRTYEAPRKTGARTDSEPEGMVPSIFSVGLLPRAVWPLPDRSTGVTHKKGNGQPLGHTIGDSDT